MAQVSWGHYLNIHKYFVDKCKLGLPLDDIFQEPVCVTEKLDGSNLGIQIALRGGSGPRQYFIVALMGRNSVLWAPPEGTDGTAVVVVPNTKYGNAGALESLPTAMLAFASAVANALGVDDLIVYGEAYRGEEQKKASWHPFGYKVRSTALTAAAVESAVDAAARPDAAAFESDGDASGDEDGGLWTKFGLASTVHQLFASHQNVPVFNTTPSVTAEPSLAALPCRNAFAEALVAQSQTSHVVCPPLLLFSGGSLGSAIETLAPMLTAPIARSFEGVFIVCESRGGGFKWKTGLHEEQKGIPNAEELSEMGQEGFHAKIAKVEAHVDGDDNTLNNKIRWMRSTIPLGFGFLDEKSAAYYSTLYNVFRARPTFAAAPAKKSQPKSAQPAAAKEIKPIEVDVMAAVSRELSKTIIDIEAVPKKLRGGVVDTLIPLVVAEVRLTFEESGMRCPYSDSDLNSVAKAKTMLAVMKMPVQE
jgi:hypothetical protein